MSALTGSVDYGDIDECLTCDEDGFVLVCPDDVCQGLGECIHGDGYLPCPYCKGVPAP